MRRWKHPLFNCHIRFMLLLYSFILHFFIRQYYIFLFRWRTNSRETQCSWKFLSCHWIREHPFYFIRRFPHEELIKVLLIHCKVFFDSLELHVYEYLSKAVIHLPEVFHFIYKPLSFKAHISEFFALFGRSFRRWRNILGLSVIFV